MTLTQLLVLAFAGLVAGVLNAVAGGGTFLTFPALVWFGLPPVAANATSTLAAMPGYIGSAWAFRHDMRAEGTLGLRPILACAALGSLLGAGLLIVTPGEVFSGAVPWLLLVATLLFAAGPTLLRLLRRNGRGDAGPLVAALTLIAVSTYGGYFNGGLGIILLAAFGLLGYTDIHGMNGLKCLLSAVISVLSAVAFAFSGLIAWAPALVIAIAITIGGVIGARQSRKIRRTGVIRAFVTLVGLAMTIAFFVT
ncbi:sulfite exporter TauE/SafE family protein [Vannielia litorea]|uniref:sulfite exporter TauE/SafE family protein n=1 Tax=Vannielia litorea TaxID=1217970 RepID=UPI001BCF5761|nr:sulfite exporter TauE/SafE family protein [Vannielia litorea]MBS8226106.1 sulfite exporter TauE/SafE family protein [Vannielia litorea]